MDRARRHAALVESITAEPIAELAALAGVPAGAAGPFAPATTFTVVPSTFDDADDRPGLVRFNDGRSQPSDLRLPASWGDAELPLVYVTYGSVTATVGPFGACTRRRSRRSPTTRRGSS